MTADVVNLRQFRKRKDRADKQAEAEQNRTRHGRTNGEKARDTLAADRRKADLDNKKLGQEDPSAE